jgi:hypothetical protein
MTFPYLDAATVNRYSQLLSEKIDYSFIFDKRYPFYATWKGQAISEKTEFDYNTIYAVNIRNKKTIPDNILKLKNLEYLSLERTDTIDFDLLRNLKYLKYIIITDFQCIQGNISNNKNLQVLYIRSANDSIVLPDNIYNTSTLQSLSLLGNFVIDKRINKLTALKELELTSFSLSALIKIRNPLLKYISVEASDTVSLLNVDAEFRDNSIEYIRYVGQSHNPCTINLLEFPNLKFLSVENCRISNVDFSVYEVDSLKILSFKNDLLKRVPRFISMFPNLEHLDLSHNSITEIDPSLNLLTKLKSVNFYDNAISTISDKLNMESLEGLYLGANRLETFPEIKIPHIQQIYLWRNNFNDIPAWLLNLDCTCEINFQDNPVDYYHDDDKTYPKHIVMSYRN